MKLIIPKHLRKGDTVGIVAPAGPITKEQADSCVQKVRDAGFVPMLADGICNRHCYLAGTDKDRAFQLNSMFNDKNVRAILCARGGYGTTRILDMLDYDALYKDPKIIAGYSDITALNLAVYKMTHMVTFHSSMLVPVDNQYTRDSMWSTFQKGKKGYTVRCDSPSEGDSESQQQRVTVLREGRAQGTLVGGNLTLLENLIGTKYDFNLYNKILFIEEICEPLYKVDRMLTHLKNAKDLSGVRGIIFGKFHGCGEAPDGTLTLDSVLDGFCEGLDIPVIKYYSFGHVPSRCTFAVGARAEIRTSDLSVRYLEDVVE